ncbi:MAG: NAD(P)/FAD-dependent oxidoreductase, partial [Pseudomonadota bacterium]
VIIGAGHNALVCAAYLARAGQKVLVLEATDAPGGLASARDFHPGFSVGVAHTIGHFSQTVIRDLKLTEHGYAPSTALPLINVADDAGPVIMDGKSLTGGTEEDRAAYPGFCEMMEKFARTLAPFWNKTMPRLSSRTFSDLSTFGQLGLKLRGLGRTDMLEFLRVASLPARDLADEFFTNDAVKAAICWDGLIGSRMAPRSPNSAVLAMLYRLSEGYAGMATAGVQNLVRALTAVAEGAGAEIRREARVKQIDIRGDESGLKATGVTLDSGETIEADQVVSGVDPQQTFLDLIGVRYLDIGFTNRVRRLRCRGLVAKLHLALEGAPEFTGLPDARGRLLTAPDMDAIEFAYDDSKYGEVSESLLMEIVVPSAYEATLAPSGDHVLSAHLMYVPYERQGGWTEAARDQLKQQAIATLTRHAPKIEQQIRHAELLTPADLETTHGVTGGHWHHTEFAMDQMLMMRPTYGAAQYTTPIPGLYVCSAGCHPGGDLAGAAGRNAARELLK